MYQTPDEFVEKVKLALASEPIPLSPGLQHLLSWEAATERFINCAELDKLPPRATKGTSRKKKILSNEEANGKTMALSLSMPDFGNILDRGLAFAHYFASGIEVARLAAGALPGTMHMDEQHRKDLGLPVPAAKSFYRW
jgi:digalactosyldiacylglycerol synthase